MIDKKKKVCTKCDDEKLITDFSKKNDGYSSFCKECKNKISRSDYQNNPELKKKVAVRNKLRRRNNRKFLFEYLLSHPCVDCGETDPLVLEFDHVRGKKRKIISELIGSNCGLETIKTEIEKCEVRCSNCHKRKTAKDQGWYKEFLKD